MRRILLMGCPGSGKSTQGQKLAEFLGYPWISTGEILRSSKEQWIVEKLKTAELFDDDFVGNILENALSEVEDAIIDGFPRTEKQAQKLLGLGVTEIVEISLPENEALKRLSSRGREQDDAIVARERITEYNKMRAEVLNVLQNAGIKYTQIDGSGSIDEVFERIKEVL